MSGAQNGHLKEEEPGMPFQLPGHVIQQWQSLIRTANLSETQAALVWASIRYALPPVSKHALTLAIDRYVTDYEVTCCIDANTFISLLEIPEKGHTSIGQSHPLFYAMTDHRRGHSLSQLDDSFQQSARRMLSDYFSSVDPESDAGILYTDVQQCRDVLRSLADINTPAPPKNHTVDRYMIDQINRHLVGRRGVLSDLLNKIRRFKQLYAGINSIEIDDAPPRLPGIRRISRRKNKGSSRIAKKRRSDSGLTSSLRHALQQAAAQPPIPMTNRQEDDLDRKSAARQAGWSIETGNRSYRASISASSSGDVLDNEAVTIRRQAPSVLTQNDDRELLKQVHRQAAVDSLLSMSDIQRLTPTQISETLTICRDTPAAWSLAVLLLATGLPLKRLEKLIAADSFPADPTTLDTDTPGWHPERHLLWYQLLDGPSGGSHDAHRTVVLSLPAVLNNALKASLEESSKHQPLRSAPRLLKRELKRAFSDTCGQRPSPLRLTASSWLLIRSLARDDVAARALSGQFGVTHGAPAAYRQLEPGELNALFQSVLACLIPEMELKHATAHRDTNGRPRESNISPVSDGAPPSGHEAFTWHTGSDRAWPVSRFRPWFATLHAAMLRAVQVFHRPLIPAERRPEDLLEVVSYSAAHTYLTLLLTTGCRPHARRVRCELLDKELWIADKDSPNYRESRVIPAATQLRDALMGHQSLLFTATQWLTQRGYQVEDLREPGQMILPGRYRLTSTRHRRITTAPIDHTTFIELLNNLAHGPDDPAFQFATTARNVTRHSVTTFLRQALPEPQLSALLGHAGIGFRHSAPGSIASPPQRGAFQSAITALLSDAGYTPLPWKEVAHALGQ